MIDQSRLLSLFEQLVSIDSPSFSERALCDFLQERLRALGLSPAEDSSAVRTGGNCGNLYTWVHGDPAFSPLLFCAHMDTVEPSRGKRMQIHEAGTITSSGATVLGADDCAGIAAILEALTALKQEGLPHRPLEILFTAAEEPYCAGIAEFDFSALRSKEAYVFDLSGPVGSAAYQAPTILSFRATFCGRCAHAGFSPEDGIHAIKAAGLAVAQVPCGRTDADTTVNFGTISGGTADNIVPDRCVLTGEIRSFSDAKATAQLKTISDALQSAAKACRATVEIQSKRHTVAYRIGLAYPVVKRFQCACAQLGLPEHLCTTHGGSDNNPLVQHGIRGLVLATAMNNCHSCSEYTTRDELARAAELALFLMRSKE